MGGGCGGVEGKGREGNMGIKTVEREGMHQ